jgi:hypothetical protein
MADDPGVLGNLPRSRPGRRSEKRGGTWSEAAGSGAAAGGASEAPKRQARARKTATASRSTASRKPQPRPAPPPSSSDPLSDAIRLAGGVAEASVKTAVKVAGGVLKRLPRP